MTAAALVARLVSPVDARPLYAFRVTYGVVVAGWVAYQFVTGYAYEHYLGLTVRFPFIDALPILPDTALLLLFDALFVFGLCCAAGVFARASAFLCGAALTYFFLLEKCLYQNHLYLMCMLGFLLALTPAHEGWSVARALRKKAQATIVPAWSLWLFRAQIGVVYVGAGIAKLNADWLSRQPVTIWLSDRADWPVMGPLLSSSPAPYVVAYGGLAFDLFVVPALLWRRTRVAAAAAAVCFHLANALLFDIDVFPWLMIPTTLVLFVMPAAPPSSSPPSPPSPSPTRRDRVILAVLALHFVVQVALPFRHLALFAVDPMWSEEGHRFAWRMMLRWKETEARFFVVERRGTATTTWEIDPTPFVRPFQYDEVVNHPDVLRTLCAWLAAHVAEERPADSVEIHVVDDVVMNGHDARLLVDPAVDLAHVPPTPAFSASPWIIPRDDEGRQAAARVAAAHLADAAEAPWRTHRSHGLAAPDRTP